MLRLFIIFIGACIGINYYVSARDYEGPVSDHFNGKKFYNISSENSTSTISDLDEPLSKKSFLSFVVKKLTSSWGETPLLNGQAVPKDKNWGSDIDITYINHSTMLVQTEGLNILTDPVWSKRVSPFSFLGPKRHMPVGVDFDNLPKIDIILLSHNHYDHMDLDTLKRLSKRDNPTIYVGLGNKKYLESRKINNVFEMDWGDKKVYSDGVSINAVPAQHFSGRSLTDRDKTLWLGFVFKTQNGDIYFAGDTGYGPFVEEIKKSYPNGFRLAFLPIGAYEPRNFMKKMHTSPDDALKMYKELKVQNAIPIHFGTFDLALEKQNDPTEVLKELLNKEENKSVKWNILWNGQSLNIK